MARLPIPGSDKGTWGDILNDFLTVSLSSDGTLKDTGVVALKYVKPGTGIPKSDLSAGVQASLDNADAAAAGTVADGSITTAKLNDLAVTAAKIANTTITNAQISASAAIDQSKISGLTTSLSGKANTSHAHTISDITATGTASASTYLRGDGSWSTPAGGGGVDTANSPGAGEWAKFTDADTLEGRTTAELKSDIALTKSDVGLANVDNTSDANKPVSTLVQDALDDKADVGALTAHLAADDHDIYMKVVNTDGDPGRTHYVGSIDPSGSYTLAIGDLWDEI